ncbi:MAG TPA: ABC transporter ATP-binding protein [Dehalococcoidia bacterium]|nr:ABC transporter ATP-binding protein [Dehalococcoidia bacterium]
MSDLQSDFVAIAGLSKRFGDVQAVDGVTLDVERGHTFALLGPSGCGKTTLLRLIAGFERADAGSISIGGRVVEGPGVRVAPEKRRAGMVFQDYALFPHMSVADNVAFGLRGKDGKRRVESLIDIVGLGGLGSRMPHELSGGQQQRVALARTLASEPDVVLLDEPFSNLDPTLRAHLRSEVRQILEHLEMTAIFVTHDQEEALSVSERLAIMMDGRIVQTGRPEDVYPRPANRRVAEFLGDANFFPGEIEAGQVQFELGRVAADEPAGHVEVMVRPEALTLSAKDGVSVEVLHSEYFGHDQLVTVRLPSGADVKVRLLPGRALDRGQRLGLRLSGDPVIYRA